MNSTEFINPFSAGSLTIKLDYSFLYFSSNKYKRITYTDACFVQLQKKYMWKKRQKKCREIETKKKISCGVGIDFKYDDDDDDSSLNFFVFIKRAYTCWCATNLTKTTMTMMTTTLVRCAKKNESLLDWIHFMYSSAVWQIALLIGK